MKAYRTKARVTANGVLHIDALPFEDGALVEVIVLASDDLSSKPLDLRGKVVTYQDPAEPVATDDWEAHQ